MLYRVITTRVSSIHFTHLAFFNFLLASSYDIYVSRLGFGLMVGDDSVLLYTSTSRALMVDTNRTQPI